MAGVECIWICRDATIYVDMHQKAVIHERFSGYIPDNQKKF